MLLAQPRKRPTIMFDSARKTFVKRKFHPTSNNEQKTILYTNLKQKKHVFLYTDMINLDCKKQNCMQF